MSTTHFSSWPSFSEEEAESVKQVLLSNKVNYWTGTECRKFEKEFADYTDTKYAVALSNGTVALDVTFKALAIGKGDEVIVTSRTFIASVSSIITAGAIPVFADVDIDSQNITVDTINKVLTSQTRAIVCVHLAGWPCDMDSIIQFAKEHDLYVIEDCAQAHGAKYKGKSVGSFGHVGAWSFCQDKIMTTGGEGGMVTTNDTDLWKKMWSYKDHGKSWDAVYETEHPLGFRWLHESFGTNWRMTEMQAAIGRIQLKKMSEWNSIRNRNAELFITELSKINALRIPLPPDDIIHAWYKFYVFLRIDLLRAEWDRTSIIQEISKQGVPCFEGTCSEVYLEKAFDNTKYRPKKQLPVAKQLGATSLMFLVHPTLKIDEIKKMTSVITDIFSRASI